MNQPQPRISARIDQDGSPRESAGNGDARCPGRPVRRVDDEWRRWIAENLIIGSAPQGVIDAMVASGIPLREAELETERASRSPYVRGSELLRTRLGEVDRLLASYRNQRRMHSKAGVIERRDRLSRGEFLDEYYSANRPVAIAGMMEGWPALTRWNLDYFAAKLGHLDVDVRVGHYAGEPKVEREKPIIRMRFPEFVGRVREAGVSGDFYLTSDHNFTNRAVLAELWGDVPPIPEYLRAEDRPDGSLLLAPRGATTIFRHELANHFMALVIGRDRVKVAPSWDIPLMRNEFHWYSNIDSRRRADATAPGVGEPQILEYDLSPGEVLFVPVGWMYRVEAVELSAAVSFTNFAFDNDFASFYSTYQAV